MFIRVLQVSGSSWAWGFGAAGAALFDGDLWVLRRLFGLLADGFCSFLFGEALHGLEVTYGLLRNWKLLPIIPTTTAEHMLRHAIAA